MKMVSTAVLLTFWASAVASAIPLEQQHPLADLSTDPSAHVVSEGVTQSPAGVAASGPRGRFLHITGACRRMNTIDEKWTNIDNSRRE